ncbi:tetrahydroberberine oxidase-like [Magnolia sinica]|uniref:tetrahydroberberine oxidase-like n=1 Tax=Magnolia sinica TaxID=86752 RepID=UPI002659DE21|nr:tetrahydroberberine oxidase-like [Magnolia sinica]
MGLSVSSSYLALISLLFLSASSTVSIPIQNNFLQCLSSHFPTPSTASQLIYTPNTSSYISTLQSSIQNLRFLGPTTPKPLFIITPTNASHIQASIICSKTHALNIRIRSGGHDYEGLSYLSLPNQPFIILDLVNLHSITVDLAESTAWVQSGATLGELYYTIAQKSGSHGFPAGLCPTVGVGGHISGGGIGTMMRKYGLAADNVVDAYLIDADGRIHDRKSMGEDLFWAIRGGGASSFGVILSWKIRLVYVPPTVTVFTVQKSLEQGAIKLVERWQQIAYKFNENLFIRVAIKPSNEVGPRSRTLQVEFNSLFLGTVEELLPLMGESFPELGLKVNDCLGMSWIQSVLYFAGYPYGKSDPIEVLLDRNRRKKNFFKGKSDFLEEPISQFGLEMIWERFMEEENVLMIIDPLGGRMDEISTAEIAFPYRRGYLYNIQYRVSWNGVGEDKRCVDWIRRLYGYVGPHVSKNPRAAYINYRDLDLGGNGKGNFSYSDALEWGRRYFNGNFLRLARVKGVVDPTNFFRDEQSIPPIF